MDNNLKNSKGIIIFTSIIFVLSGILLSWPNYFILSVAVSVVAGAILLYNDKFITLSLTSILITAVSILVSHSYFVMSLLIMTIIPLSLIIGRGIKRNAEIKKMVIQGSIVLSVSIFILMISHAIVLYGNFSFTNMRLYVIRLINGIGQIYENLLKSTYRENIDSEAIGQIRTLVREIVNVLKSSLAGIIISGSVVISFVLTVIVKGIIINRNDNYSLLKNFRITRTGGIIYFAGLITAAVTSGIIKNVAENFLIVIAPALLLEGALYIVNLYKTKKLFKSALFFYLLIIGVFTFGLTQFIIYLGAYDSLNINWSKLKPKQED